MVGASPSGPPGRHSGGTIYMDSVRPQHFDFLRAHGPAIASVAGHINQTFPVRVGEEVINTRGGFVSGDYFKTLGTRPVVGRQAARLVMVGALAGLALTLPLTYALPSMFIGISPFDPLAFVPMILALVAVAALASILPARRAASIDPVSAIRAD